MVIRHNQVLDTGGSTNNDFALGIFVTGPGNNILDNQVSTTTAVFNGSAYGIYLLSANNSMVHSNRLSDVVTPGAGISYGIYLTSSTDIITRNNMISSEENGVYYVPGSTGLYGSNYTSNVTTPFTGGTAAGTTNYTNP